MYFLLNSRHYQFGNVDYLFILNYRAKSNEKVLFTIQMHNGNLLIKYVDIFLLNTCKVHGTS